MIRMQLSVSADSACSRRAIYSRSPAVSCLPWRWNGRSTRAPIRRPHSGSWDWSSRCRWLHCRCPPAIWRTDSVENVLSLSRRFLARSPRWRSLWSRGNTFPFLRFPYCAKAIALWQAIATIFERHHPAFHFDDASIPLIYLLLFIGAIARTFSWAARSSFFPTLVSRDSFANAVTWNNSVFQIGSVVGPGVSGLLVAHVGFPLVYMLDALCAFSFFLLVLPIRRSTQSRNQTEKSTWRESDRRHAIRVKQKGDPGNDHAGSVCGLLGGATALLPIFADQILHCGPIGLGWMRAAPAVGAFAMALLVAHLPPMKHAGKTLLWCVTGFGIATILFGLSKTFWLSLGLLFFIGAFDSVSVIIRGSIVQLVTPDEMRGRVSAVNNIFIGTSNEFGALESGLTAALFGPVISVVAGGIGTILVVLGVSLRWPQTRKIGALDPKLLQLKRRVRR